MKKIQKWLNADLKCVPGRGLDEYRLDSMRNIKIEVAGRSRLGGRYGQTISIVNNYAQDEMSN